VFLSLNSHNHIADLYSYAPVFLSLFIADLYALSKGEVAGTKNNESGPVKTSMLWPTPSSDGSQGFHIQTTS
jgi:hypothetical protein